jgi:hypothetical protein
MGWRRRRPRCDAILEPRRLATLVATVAGGQGGRRRRLADPRRAHSLKGALEVVNAQEEPEAARELVSDRAHLTLTVGLGEKQSGVR